MQIQGKVFWCEFKEVDKSVKLNNKILSNKDKFDKDKAKSHMITGLMSLSLQQDIIRTN